MAKSSNTERARRINTAFLFLKQHGAGPKAVTEMMKQYNLSKRQAYRYIQEARKLRKSIPIPETKMAFTVKLSPSLIQRLRDHARSTGQSLSEIVTRALEAFLCDGRRRS
jgi:hypothetical protein